MSVQEVQVEVPNQEGKGEKATTKTITNSSSKSKSAKRTKRGGKAATIAISTTKKNNKTNEEKAAAPTTTATQKEINPIVQAGSVLMFMISVFWIMLKVSPDNYYTSRGVFESPLFTREECNHLIEMAEDVAKRNYEIAKNVESELSLSGNTQQMNETIKGFLKEPVGWQKKRHDSYPTTDLNLVTDPFTKSDRTWIREKLDARLAPTMSRLFGIPPRSIRALDVSKNSELLCLACPQSGIHHG